MKESSEPEPEVLEPEQPEAVEAYLEVNTLEEEPILEVNTLSPAELLEARILEGGEELNQDDMPEDAEAYLEVNTLEGGKIPQELTEPSKGEEVLQETSESPEEEIQIIPVMVNGPQEEKPEEKLLLNMEVPENSAIVSLRKKRMEKKAAEEETASRQEDSVSALEEAVKKAFSAEPETPEEWGFFPVKKGISGKEKEIFHTPDKEGEPEEVQEEELSEAPERNPEAEPLEAPEEDMEAEQADSGNGEDYLDKLLKGIK